MATLTSHEGMQHQNVEIIMSKRSQSLKSNEMKSGQLIRTRRAAQVQMQIIKNTNTNSNAHNYWRLADNTSRIVLVLTLYICSNVIVRWYYLLCKETADRQLFEVSSNKIKS
jgi:hypothetical protein